MGDAGSGFLGVVFGVLIDAAQYEPALFWCWLILLGSFIVDATVTLLRRLMRLERIYEAHRPMPTSTPHAPSEATVR
jgi:Fuc2NAc and GlcNAc transferase